MSTSCTLRTRKFMSNRLLKRRQFVSVRIVQIFPLFAEAFQLSQTRRLRVKEERREIFALFLFGCELRGNRCTREVFTPNQTLLLTTLFFFTTDSRCSSPRTRECPEGTHTISQICFFSETQYNKQLFWVAMFHLIALSLSFSSLCWPLFVHVIFLDGVNDVMR